MHARKSKLAVCPYEVGLWPGLHVLLRGSDSSISPAEKRLAKLIKLGAKTFGRPLLDAPDEEALKARVDAVIEDSEFYRLNSLLIDCMPEMGLQRSPDPVEFRPIIEEAFGAELISLFTRAIEFSSAVAQVVGRYAREHEEQLRENNEQSRKRPLAFLTNPAIPVECAGAMLAGLKADACCYAIIEVLCAKRSVSSWLAWCLGEQLLQGSRDYLRMLASLPNADVSEDLIPQEERLDIAKICAARDEAERGFQLMAFLAAQSGEEVYAPFGDPDDDE